MKGNRPEKRAQRWSKIGTLGAGGLGILLLFSGCTQKESFQVLLVLLALLIPTQASSTFSVTSPLLVDPYTISGTVTLCDVNVTPHQASPSGTVFGTRVMNDTNNSQAGNLVMTIGGGTLNISETAGGTCANVNTGIRYAKKGNFIDLSPFTQISYQVTGVGNPIVAGACQLLISDFLSSAATPLDLSPGSHKLVLNKSGLNDGAIKQVLFDVSTCSFGANTTIMLSPFVFKV